MPIDLEKVLAGDDILISFPYRGYTITVWRWKSGLKWHALAGRRISKRWSETLRADSVSAGVDDYKSKFTAARAAIRVVDRRVG